MSFADQLGFTFEQAPSRRIWRVADLVSAVRTTVERGYTDVWVEGEVSNFRPADSGHLYFTLKDGDAQLRVVMFRSQARLLRFRPDNGMQIIARGRVTSPRGAALHDMLNVLSRRHESVGILIYPAQVQGESAAAEVAAGVKYFNRAKGVDVIIIARGGGSLEDLAAFNDESLARTISASAVPVISAVGHETDFTIADFVADLRAPTPSAAAELVIESKHRLSAHLAHLHQRL